MKKHPILAFIILFVVVLMVAATIMTGIALITSPHQPTFMGENVAVVAITGPIFESEEVLKRFKELEEDKHVKAIVLRLNSPGGAVAPSQEIYQQILKIKKTKKVVVSMSSVAASGAYYIACGADKIMANPGTLTGSIGVILESFGFDKLIKKVDVESRIVQSGAYKSIGNPFKELTPQGREYLQNISDNVYAQFVGDVAKSRNIPIEKMPLIAEGRIFTGEQALKNGLVDGLGNLYDAIDEAKKLAGLNKNAKVIWPKEPSPFEKFFKGNEAHALWEILMKKALPRFLMSEKDIPQYQL